MNQLVKAPPWTSRHSYDYEAQLKQLRYLVARERNLRQDALVRALVEVIKLRAEIRMLERALNKSL